MKTKIEIKTVFGKILFTYENKNATIKDAVEKAAKEGADLSEAYLSGANLSEADLSEADLSEADLSGANLSGANLSEADLSGADLSEAYLSGANLSGANLSEADLSGAVKIPMYCKWNFGITDGMIHVGCKKRSIEDWKKFLESDEVIETKRDSDEFRKIAKVIKALIAYQEG